MSAELLLDPSWDNYFYEDGRWRSRGAAAITVVSDS
jgi:hypothetical protein